MSIEEGVDKLVGVVRMCVGNYDNYLSGYY